VGDRRHGLGHAGWQLVQFQVLDDQINHPGGAEAGQHNGDGSADLLD
jgi:hypothetical protein